MKNESAIIFDCAGNRLVGILHNVPQNAELGVVIVVGGPQYRVGSHRQFVLMARRLAEAGIPVLRFDARGMGDADGTFETFENLETDIRAAIDCSFAKLSGLKTVALLGLCDAASAIGMYCSQDERVSHLILINPWARSEQSEARTYLKHYYVQRLLQRSLWRKVLSGKFSIRNSLGGIWGTLRTIGSFGSSEQEERRDHHGSYVDRMRAGLNSFSGDILLILSGRDLTAREFSDRCVSDGRWRRALQRSSVQRIDIAEADHTMSRRVNLDDAAIRIITWMGKSRGN